MQTFLPYPSFTNTARCLDYRRLGKQRVEAKQIIDILEGNSKSNAWKNHPAVLMWKGYIVALKAYYNAIVSEWIDRGYKNTMPKFSLQNETIIYPEWFGKNEFHSSHRQTLLSKNLEHYKQFNWQETPKYEYWWPTKQQ